MLRESCLRSFLAISLVALAGTTPVAAQTARPHRPKSDSSGAAEPPAFDFRAGALSAIDEAAASAGKIADGSESAVALARVADGAWDVEEPFARKLFERAFALASDEASRDGDRGLAGRAARKVATKLYAKHDFDAAIRLLDDDARSQTSRTALDDDRSLAGLFAEVGLDLVETDTTRAADLARASLARGYVTYELAELIAALPPDVAGSLLVDAIRAAGFGRDPSIVALSDLDLTVRIFVSGPPVTLGRGGTPEIARLWAESAYQVLQSDYAEVVDARAGDRAPSVSDAELVGVASYGTSLAEIFEAAAPDLAGQAEPLITELAASAPSAPARARSTVGELVAAMRLGPKAMLDVADKTQDPVLADALYRASAFAIASDASDPRREQTAKSAVAKIRDDRVRALAADESVLRSISLAADDGRWGEAASGVKRLSQQDLRVQTYGALAHAAAQKGDQTAVELADDARGESKTSSRTTRVVAAMLWSSLAASTRKDEVGGLAFANEAMFAFDRVVPSVDNSDLKGTFSLDLGASFAAADVSPTNAPEVLELPLAATFTALAPADPIGLQNVAASVKTLRRRSEAFLALARAFLAAEATTRRRASEESPRRARRP